MSWVRCAVDRRLFVIPYKMICNTYPHLNDFDALDVMLRLSSVSLKLTKNYTFGSSALHLGPMRS